MREIKFRAWLKNENRMINPVIQITMDTPHPIVAWYEDMHDALSGRMSDAFLDEVGMMQYTGLKDKNGKEIYEGDVIACKFHPQFVERINWEQVDIIGKVFWDLCGFSLNARNAEDDRRYPDLVDLNCNESEVIGNVWEDGELLNDRKKTETN